MGIKQLFTSAFLITWLAGSIDLASPLLLAALGEIFDELAGVLNVGIEGTILMGALAGFLVSFLTGNPWLGLVGAIGIGILVNLPLAWMYINVGADQVVVGIIFNSLSLGLVDYLYRVVLGEQASPQKAAMLPIVHIPGISTLPFVGPVLFSHGIMVYVTFILVLVAGFVLYHTKFGLKIRAVGEHPRAADAAGIRITRMRYIGVLLSGATAAMAGGFYVLNELGFFRDNIVSGRGFIALAIVIFGRWNPYKAAVAALIFGAADALQLSLQIFNFNIPPQVLVSLPYVLTVLAMSGLLGKAISPSALMIHFKKE
jgi:simple sugar transport system permease protein